MGWWGITVGCFTSTCEQMTVLHRLSQSSTARVHVFNARRMSMSGGYASYAIIRFSHKWNWALNICVWKLPVTAVIGCLCTFSFSLCEADQYYQHIHSCHKLNFDLENVTEIIVVFFFKWNRLFNTQFAYAFLLSIIFDSSSFYVSYSII